jgi:hypothetical protein
VRRLGSSLVLDRKRRNRYWTRRLGAVTPVAMPGSPCPTAWLIGQQWITLPSTMMSLGHPLTSSVGLLGRRHVLGCLLHSFTEVGSVAGGFPELILLAMQVTFLGVGSLDSRGLRPGSPRRLNREAVRQAQAHGVLLTEPRSKRRDTGAHRQVKVKSRRGLRSYTIEAMRWTKPRASNCETARQLFARYWCEPRRSD